MRSYIVFVLFLISCITHAQKCMTANVIMDRPVDLNIEKTDFIIHIPVVFHLVLPIDLLNKTSDYVLENLIERTNQDFSKNNIEIQQIPMDEKLLIGNAQIKFVIAGIERKATIEDEFGLTDNIYYSQLGGSDSWSTRKFLNIWIVELPEGFLGFSSNPWSNSGEKDGLVISLSSVMPRYASNFSHRTLTHEIGHFLGLMHIWGNLSSECDEDDGIGDTPAQSSPHYQCPNFKNYSCEESRDAISWNFMDYSPDCCMAGFTNGQVALMRGVLLNERIDLKISGDGYVDSVYHQSMQSSQLLIFPNPATDHIVLDWYTYAEDRGANVVTVEVIGIDGVRYGCYNVSGDLKSLVICINHIPDGLFYIVAKDNKGRVLIPKLFQHVSK